VTVIEPKDAQFHEPTSADPLWGETNYFGLYVPQVPMNIGVYALFRTNVGVVTTNVSVNSRKVALPWAADYWDAWAQTPIPMERDLLDYRLASGLHVVCAEPNKVWDVDYDDGGTLSLHFRYTALMNGFDIHDPAQDPMVAAKAAGSDFSWGHAYSGHFDQTGHFEGEIVLRGQRHEIDCVSTMDHSWGIRQERQHTTMSWLHAHFSPDLAMHAIFDFDPAGGPDAATPLQLTHGYILDHGEAVGLKAGQGRTARRGFYPEHIELSVTDARDRAWDFAGTPLTTFPWQAWPGTVGHNVLARWQCQEQTGYGEIMDFIGLHALTEIYSRG
jgi:hypothetical protein